MLARRSFTRSLFTESGESSTAARHVLPDCFARPRQQDKQIAWQATTRMDIALIYSPDFRR